MSSITQRSESEEGERTARYGDQVKKIYVVQNGNQHLPAKKVVVSKKLGEKWQKLLQRVSDEVRPIRGYVRNLHSPTTGRLVSDYQQLESGQVYVAVCEWEKFTPAKSAINHQLLNNPMPLFKVSNASTNYVATRYVPFTGSVPYFNFPAFEYKR